MKSLYFKFHMIWLKTVGIIYKKLKAYILKIGGVRYQLSGAVGELLTLLEGIWGPIFF